MSKFNNVQNECVKTEDGRVVWLARDIAVCVVVSILCKGELYTLVSKRGPATPNFQDHLNYICGYLDRNETITEAAKREVFEETGVDLDLLSGRVLFSDIENNRPWVISDAHYEGKQNVTMRYGVLLELDELDEFPLFTNEFASAGEVIESRWVHVDTLNAIKEPSEGVDTLFEDVWAFNHKQVTAEWLERVNKFLEMI